MMTADLLTGSKLSPPLTTEAPPVRDSVYHHYPDYRRLLWRSALWLCLGCCCFADGGKDSGTKPNQWRSISAGDRCPECPQPDWTHISSQNCPGPIGPYCVIKGHSFSFASPLWVEGGEREAFPRFIPLMAQTDRGHSCVLRPLGFTGVTGSLCSSLWTVVKNFCWSPMSSVWRTLGRQHSKGRCWCGVQSSYRFTCFSRSSVIPHLLAVISHGFYIPFYSFIRLMAQLCFWTRFTFSKSF